MHRAIRFKTVILFLFAGLISSCGKKETPSATESGAAPKSEVAKPAAEPAAPPVANTSAKPETPVKEGASAPEPYAPPAAAERQFTGTVGGKAIILGLSFTDQASGPVTGWYYIEAQGSGARQLVSGTIQDGNLKLEQTVEGQVGGTFDLNADPVNKKNFLGLWKAAGRVVPAKITER